MKSIQSGAFWYCDKLNKIYISDIDAWCRIDFESHVPGDLYLDGELLTEVTIPNGITEIDRYAFRGRSSIKSITIPESVTSIGMYAFSGCSSLTSITIPSSVTSIKEFAFYDCTSLKSISIPDSVTRIYGGTFADCSSLESITIPDSIMSIGGDSDPDDDYYNYGYGSFKGCDKLNKIYISDLDAWCRISYYYLYDYVPGNLYLDGKLLTEVTIPNGITEIDRNAFSARDSIKSITIPYGLTSIGEYAFDDCNSLTSITISNSVTRIGDYAFSDCNSLKSITIPESVASIGHSAFSGCSSLTNITIPDSVTSIGEFAFSGCSSLKSITIPDSVTSIYEGTFENCSSLESITIPNSITNIGGNGDPDDYEDYEDYDVFSGCNSLTSITIPGSVSTIGAWFSGCNNLKNVTILNGVTSIGYDAFYNCSSLTNISIPNSVTSIDSYAFYNCSNLTSITIPDSVTSIGEDAFYNCSSLTSITIPDSITSIGRLAFYGCDNLKNLTIPNSVTYIGDLAFSRDFWDDNDFVIITQSQYVKDYCKSNCYAYFDKTAPSIAKLTSHNGSDIRVYFEKRDEATESNYIFENECVLGYQIKYADNKNMTGAKSIMLKDKKAASKVITGLKNGKTYYVQIQHYLKSGKVSYWSKWSPVTSVTVGQTPYNTNVSKLSTYIGSHIKVDWTKTAGASGYHIKYADNSSMTGAKEVMIKGNSTFTKTLTGLKNGKTYYVKIQTYRTVSGKTYWSSWSPAKSIKVDQIPYGSSIKKLTQESATKIKVTWDKAPSASGYHIQYRWYDGNSDKYVTKDIIINGNGTVSKTITGLKKNTDYDVRIQTFRKISGKTYWSSWSKYKYVYLWTW